MKGKFKRILSTVLACVMVLALLPASALAGDEDKDRDKEKDPWDYLTAAQSTVTFKIVNGTWKTGADFGGTVNQDRTEVSFTVYKYSDAIGYVYECSDQSGKATMETILSAILGSSASTYITPDEGYTLNGMSTQDWDVENGGLTGSTESANTQMTTIKNNIHGYDTYGTPSGGFQMETVYVLTLTKDYYSVTYTFQSGTADADLPATVMSQEPLDTTTMQYNDTVSPATSFSDAEETTSDGKQYVWTFGGWFTDMAMTQAAVFPITVTDDIDLYGKWTRTEKAKVTITFDANGGQWAAAVEGYTMGTEAAAPYTTAAKNVEKGSALTAIATNPTREGYTFTGWYDAMDCQDEVAFVNQSVYANVTLYAGWELTPPDKVTYVVRQHLIGEDGKEDIAYNLSDLSADKGTAIRSLISGYEKDQKYDDQDYIYVLEETKVVPDGTTLTQNGTAIDLYYYLDAWKDANQTDEDDEDSKTGGDGVPDCQQVVINYVVIPAGKGEVSNTLDVVTLESGTGTASSTASNQQDSGYAFAYWSRDDQGDTVVTYEKAFAKTLGTVDLGKEYTYYACFLPDTKGNITDPETKGDGTPDAWQAFVKFTSAGNGTVGKENESTFQVFNLEINSETGKYNDSVTKTPTTVTPVPGKGYAFDIWTKDNADAAVNPFVAQTLAGGKTVVYTAHFDEDKIGGTDPEDPGDGTPDKYQRTVTYKIENGAWAVKDDKKDTADKVYVLTVKEKNAEGIWADKKVTLAGTIPDVANAVADADYSESEGSWGTNEPTADTEVKDNLTYTYTFGTRNTWTITVTVENGTADVSSPVTVSHGADQSITFTAREGYVLDSVTVDDAAAELANGSYTFTNVTQDHTIAVKYKEVPARYTVYTEIDKHGTITETKTYNAGETAEVFFNADRNYYINSVTVDGVRTKDYSWDRTEAAYVITFPDIGADHTVVVTTDYDDYVPVTPSKPTEKPEEKPELNIESHIAYIIGYVDGTVRPLNNISRSEVATIFFRLLTDESRAHFWSQTNPYSDVDAGDWFNNAISTLSNAGIITGYPDSTFRPEAPITRSEFAAIAARFSEVIWNGGNSFSDVPENHWAVRYIALAEHLGWITGYPDGTFKPDQNITRAESMTLINRVLERAVEEEHMLPDMVIWVDNVPGTWSYEAVQEATNSHEYVRLTEPVPGQDFCYEDWQEIEEVPDWAALEKIWSTANSK